MTKVLVLYYSAYGHIEAMANAVAEGARKAHGLKPLTTERRDLEKRPLTSSELVFDGVVLGDHHAQDTGEHHGHRDVA